MAGARGQIPDVEGGQGGPHPESATPGAGARDDDRRRPTMMAGAGREGGAGSERACSGS